MAFTTQRGRPRKPPVTHDPGTPELQQKRRNDQTQEPIDRCLSHGLISAEEHRAALHLRWLHTLRHGAPKLTTHYAMAAASSATASPTHESWRSAREAEYRLALELLRNEKAERLVVGVAIYHEEPSFLSQRLRAHAWHQPHLARAIAAEYACFCAGVRALERMRHHPPATSSSHPR